MSGRNRLSSARQTPGEGEEIRGENVLRLAMGMVRPKRLAGTFASTRFTVQLRDSWRLWLWAGLTLFLCIITVVAMLAMRRWDLLAGMRAIDMTTWEIFFSAFGLMYAIIVGLLIVEAHRRWRELSSTIQGELNALGDIHDCLRYFEDSEQNRKAKEEIRKLLVQYVDEMNEYWERMKKSRVKRTEEYGGKGVVNIFRDWLTKSRAKHIKEYGGAGVADIFGDWRKKSRGEYRIEWFRGKYEDRIERFRGRGVRDIITSVRKLEPNDESNRHALGAIIDKICELTTYHTNRQESAEHGLPFSFYLFIVCMSVIIVGGILLLDVGDVWVHGLIVFATTAAVTGLFLLLYDVDRPFTGYWHIWKESLVDIWRKLQPEELSELASEYRRDMPFNLKDALAQKMALPSKESEEYIASLVRRQRQLDEGEMLAAAATLAQRPEPAYFTLLKDDILRQSSSKFVRYRTLMALERLIPHLSENQKADLENLLVTLGKEPTTKADKAFGRRINRVRSTLSISK